MPEDICKTAESCYQRVLSLLKDYTVMNESLQSIGSVLPPSSIFSVLMGSFPGMVLVINLHTSGYIYISENSSEMIGFDREEFITGGLRRTNQQFPPSHNLIITQQIFPVMFAAFEKYCLSGEYNNITASYPTQLIHKNGSKRWYLHTAKVLTTDDSGRPHLLLKTVLDIEDIKKDQYIDFSIVKKTTTGITETICKKSFYPEISLDVLSSREFEIMQLIGSGYTNAQIADQLCISLFTVKAHRRNILNKTKCKGTAELAKLSHIMQN